MTIELSFLEDDFLLYKTNKLYKVIFDQKILQYSHNDTKTEILINDIIGCSCMKTNKHDKVYLNIYAYPLSKRGRRKRERKAIIFIISKGTYDKNMTIAKTWRNAILFAIHSTTLPSSSEEPLGQHKGSDIIFSPDKKTHLLIFVNPKSGPGLANEIFVKKVKPVLDEAEVSYEVILTHRANEAFDFCRTKDLHSYDGIVTVSGDGLLYEVYNGLLHRQDWKERIATPVGVIPGGSGNAVAAFIATEIGEPYLSNPVLISALNLVKPVSVPMDLTFIHSKKGQCISFMGIGLGLIADIDIESEVLRSLGETRFTIWAIARILNLRKYRVRVSFKRADIDYAAEPFNADTAYIMKHENIMQHSQSVFDIDSPEKLSRKSRTRSLVCDNEDSLSLSADAQREEEELVKVERSSWNINDNSKGMMSEDKIENSYSESFSEHLDYLRNTHILDDPVPNDWEVIEDDFIMVHSSTIKHLSQSAILSPASTMTDGVIYLCLINTRIPKINLLKFLLTIEKGSHVNIPGIQMIPVTAFRVEPLCKKGKITVDGELIDFGPVHVTILPSIGKFLTRPKDSF